MTLTEENNYGCMYICVYVCMHVCVCARARAWVCVCARACARMRVFIVLIVLPK